MVKRTPYSIIIGVLLFGSLAACTSSSSEIASNGKPMMTTSASVAVIQESESLPEPELVELTKIVFDDTLEPTLSDTGEIVYNYEIFTMTADGTNLQNLTNNAARDEEPEWSPDGRQIAFVSNRVSNGNGSIYLMNSDGSGVQALTTNELNSESQPLWSPDGNKIAFLGSIKVDPAPGGLRLDVYVIDTDGNNLRNLTAEIGDQNFVDFFDFSWSPDGKKIVVESDEYDPVDKSYSDNLYVIDLSSSDVKQLTFNHANENPVWSPDGSTIAFSIGIGRPLEFNIALINEDGSNIRELTSGRHPLWSPSGEQLAFEHENRIYIMDADGSKIRPIANFDGTCINPLAITSSASWSQDGEKIYFIAACSNAILTVDVETGEVTDSNVSGNNIKVQP